MIRNLLLTKGYEKGYLPKNNPEMLHPVFPTANIAIRKKVFDQVGLFDTICKTSGEDVDLCIRVAKTQWEMFFESRAVVLHKYRTSFFGLLKQWYGYATSHPYIFKKHVPKCLEIYYPSNKDGLDWSAIRVQKIFGIPVPFPILIFVTPFYFFNTFLLILILTVVFKLYVLSIVVLAGGLSSWLYFLYIRGLIHIVVKREKHWLIYTLIRYVLNWVYVLGSFFAGLKLGMLYFDITREYVPPLRIRSTKGDFPNNTKHE